MDLISILGVASASAQIARVIAQAILDLSTLRGKFKDADMTIRLLIAELSTIRAAVSQLRDWAKWNSHDSPRETEYMKGVEVAVEGCQAAMEVLAEEIKDLVTGFATGRDPTAVGLGFMARARVVWSEDTMKIHQDRLHAQVLALNLLLQAPHCRSSTAQLELLRLEENRRIIQKVADDTRTLRDSISAANSQASLTNSNNRQSTTEGTIFNFDQALAETSPYRSGMLADLPIMSAEQNTRMPQTQRGDAEMAERLLRHGSHVEARDSQFMAALHYACEKGHQVVVDILLDKGASIEVIGRGGRSPLICAAAEGHRLVVEFLLRRKASIRSKEETRITRFTGQHVTAMSRSRTSFCAGRLPINDRTAAGLTPLHLAVIGSQFSAAEFLLRMNAMLKPHCRPGRTPMHYSCGSDNADIARLLLNAGAQAEAPVSGDLRKPIHIAASTGNVEIIQLLGQKGVPIDSRDSAGDRPLCIAAYHGHAEVVEKLLDFRAPLRLPFGDRSYEDSPLCVAAKEGHIDVVSVLLRRGASVRQKDELGWPPIRYAAHYGHPEVLELLLTEAATLSDDATGTSGLDHIAEHVDFVAGANISEERRGRVRELLSQAEVKSTPT